MKHWIGQNWFKLIMALGVLIVAAAVAYYLIVLPNQRESYRRQQDIEEKADKEWRERSEEEKLNQLELSRDLCISDAEISYQRDFELNSDPKPSAGENVRTWHSASIRDDIEHKLQQEKDNCFKKYPVN